MWMLMLARWIEMKSCIESDFEKMILNCWHNWVLLVCLVDDKWILGLFEDEQCLSVGWWCKVDLGTLQALNSHVWILFEFNSSDICLIFAWNCYICFITLGVGFDEFIGYPELGYEVWKIREALEEVEEEDRGKLEKGGNWLSTRPSR